jgi:hypothetical protein
MTHAELVALLNEAADEVDSMTVPPGNLDAHPLATRLRTAADALAGVGEDTARLDWLERDHNAKVYPTMLAGDFGVLVEHEEGKGFALNGKIRNAIDAARAAGEGHD